MPRPCRPRRVCCCPDAVYFKPRGIPVSALEEIILTLDELEAVRLADMEGMYQEKAAEKMNISRQTFGNIIISARKKIAEALVKGKALKIEGGKVEVMDRNFVCADCSYEWTRPYGSGRPEECPECKSRNVHRSSKNKGWTQSGSGRHGRRCGR